MAPCFSYTSVPHCGFPEKDSLRQLRKPRVEKMRRDRINTCIDQLKLLLEKELHQQEPNTKLEKADVLEMTVSFLQRTLMASTGGLVLLSPLQPNRESSASAPPPPPPPSSLRVLQDHEEHQGKPFLLAQRDFTSSSSAIISSSCSSSSTHRPTSSNKSPVWRPW